MVDTEYECPNNQSGVACPAGSPNGDFLTTKYQYKTTENVDNYTGYPRYSPYHPSVANADALMSAPDAGSFQYTTVVSKHRANGAIIHQVETDYNFLHLQQEQRVYVSDGSSSNLMLSKETSYCYPISDTAPTTGCPLTTANYQQLPSNYQSPIIKGSCQYNVTGDAATSGARRSAMTMTYDAFGNTIQKRCRRRASTRWRLSSLLRRSSLGKVAGQCIEDGHAHRDPHLDLFVDHRLDAVGDIGIDFDAAVHGAGMHDQRAGFGARQLFLVEAEEAVVFARRGHEGALHALQLQAQHHYDVDAGEPFGHGGEDLSAQPIHAGAEAASTAPPAGRGRPCG